MKKIAVLEFSTFHHSAHAVLNAMVPQQPLEMVDSFLRASIRLDQIPPLVILSPNAISKASNLSRLVILSPFFQPTIRLENRSSIAEK
jgi:hypothetical protein